MNEPTRVDFESAGGLKIAAYRWDPAGEPLAIAHSRTASASTPGATPRWPKP